MKISRTISLIQFHKFNFKYLTLCYLHIKFQIDPFLFLYFTEELRSFKHQWNLNEKRSNILHADSNVIPLVFYSETSHASFTQIEMPI